MSLFSALAAPAQAQSALPDDLTDTVVISGVIADGSGHGYPLYARIDVTGGAAPQTVFSDPFSGAYSLTTQKGLQVTLTVTALITGYETGAETLIPLADIPLNFDLPAGAECTAPGYYNLLFAETFDAVNAPGLPEGWATEVNSTTRYWRTATATADPAGWPPVSEPNIVYANTSDAPPGNTFRLYRTAGLDLTTVTGATLVFDMF
ncbi:MAG TPA: hypothetical protein PKM01_04995, partial [Anaerolineaceae bacterium]|nr:hypothetical protein [Anaerolineaceae bacterium]